MTESAPNTKRRRTSLPLLARERPNNLVVSQQPDLMELFSQRGGRMRELEQKKEELTVANEKLQQRVLAMQAEVESTKETAQKQTQASQAAAEMFKKEQESTEYAYKREMARTGDATAKLQQGESRQFAAMERADKAESELAGLKGSAKQERLALEAAIKRLEGELREVKQDAKLAERKSRQSLSQVDIGDAPFKELKAQLNEATSRADAERQTRQELETKLAQDQQRAEAAESQLREALKSTDGSNEAILRALRTELKSQEAEIAQARKIQSRVKSLAVLQEKLEAAEARAALVEKDQAAVLELQARISTLDCQLRAWESSAGDLGIDSPGQVFEKLQELRQECLAAAEKLVDKESEIREARESAKIADQQRADAEAALHSAWGLNAETSASAARFERRVALLTKEREGLHKMLASYSAEADANGHSTAGQADSPRLAATERENLVGQVGELQTQIEALEGEITDKAASEKQLREELTDALAKAARAEEQKDTVQREVKRLDLEVAQLQDRVNRGEFNSATTRVLHYVLNPEAEARKEQAAARIGELEAEIAVLRVQLQKCGQGVGSQAAGPQVSRPAATVLEAEIVVLQQKVGELTKREARLKDVFQEQAANFREAVYLLFGYRVDMAAEAASAHSTKPQSTSFVLRPQHADSPRMQLLFQLRRGRMELVPTEYSTRKLQREVETFIERFHSIPAFTANWTMELFQKQTQH